MIKGIKVKLYPTKEQETLMWKSAGVMRFAYNWALGFFETYYKLYGKSVSVGTMRKHFTKIRNSNKYPWLKEVSSEIPQQAIKDFDDARSKFFKKVAKYPRHKSKKRSTISFYHLPTKFKVTDSQIQLEKIGVVKMNDENRLPQGNYKKDKISVCNPRIKFNGRYWYLSLGIECENQPLELDENLSVGIDLGIKELATVSNFDSPFRNINKTQKIRKLKKRLRRLQRQVSRKYEKNRQGKRYVKTQNILKLERIIKLIHEKLKNIRLNHNHQVTNAIAKTKPSRIVMEDLNVTGMLKNKHLSKAIAEQGFYQFISLMKYKSEKYGIRFIQADRFYPSSKRCSQCGNVKKDLKLKDRTYHCDVCGFTLDRDKNASINLANYQLA
jgi:putative transposase